MGWIILTVGCAVLLAGLSVLIHFECLSFLDRWVRRFKSGRTVLVVTMVGLLSVHIIEIWVYAAAYGLFSFFPELGGLHIAVAGDYAWLDFVYFSAMVYTTVGFGDIVPSGGIRLITATEALVGLSLITWSASFTFLKMQALFGNKD